MKTAQVIENRMPAVQALVHIGPDAARMLIHGSLYGLTSEERLAAIFVISQIKNVPESREFLNTVRGQANMECHLAEEGLKAVER